MYCKKLIFFFLCAVLLSNVCLASCTPHEKPAPEKGKPTNVVFPDWLTPDSVALSNLGNKLSDVLINSSKVKVYSLKIKPKTTPDDIVIQPCVVRDSLLCTLTREQAAALRYSLICNGANYFKDTVNVPRIPFYPAIAFAFEKKGEVAYVFVSLTDWEWGILYEDKTVFIYNYFERMFVNRFCSYFLKQ